MKVELTKVEIAEITKTLSEDLATREREAANVNMCLRQDFINERSELIIKFEKMLDALQKGDEQNE